ncbi:UNVERIFIED_CONTAM: hypothetical protein HDU68_006114 [Siphonaria sp. JEL0065]|nr:hypothetical protein HDU68_006114 [Siphonaria sp. JEL0065]
MQKLPKHFAFKLLAGGIAVMVLLQLGIETRRASALDAVLKMSTKKVEVMDFTASPLFFVKTAETKPEHEFGWFEKFRRGNAVLIASANAAVAKAPIANNLLCSLSRNAPLAMKSLVVWATDSSAAQSLLALQQSQYANNSFAIYFDATLDLPPSKADYKHDPDSFFKLMDARNMFFEHLLGTLHLDFIFTDLDVVFTNDPFEDLNLPYGVPPKIVDDVKGFHSVQSVRNTSGIESFNDLMQLAEEDSVALGHVWHSLPDVVYSTDSRDFFHNLYDPYEGNPRIPPICGGFFFIRANGRTHAMWKYIRMQNLNDQWGMDQLLNNQIASKRNSNTPLTVSQKEGRRRFDAVLVDPLPAGIEGRRDKRSPESVVNGKEVIRVRILSQAAYRSALPHYADGGEVGVNNQDFLDELVERGLGEKEVMLHPNYCRKIIDWFNIKPFKFKYGYPMVIVTNDNKTNILQRLEKWLLNESGVCRF